MSVPFISSLSLSLKTRS